MQLLICLAQSGGKLSPSFQRFLNAAMIDAAQAMRGNPLPPLYRASRVPGEPGSIIYKPEPWAGKGIEEFANPWMVVERGCGDCDDLVIYRGAELIAAGYPCHARILHDTKTNKYHTQIARDFGPPCAEDPCLQRLGRPVSEWLIPLF